MEIKYFINLNNLPSKMNPQQTQIVEAIKNLGTDCFTKDQVIPELNKTLKTRQDTWLIFKYYQPTFTKTGLLTLEKTNKPKEVKVSAVPVVEVKAVKKSRKAKKSELDEDGQPVMTLEEAANGGW